MELRHLRYFVAVARDENVSRAALRLHVSQPGLSRQIRDLEDEIGFLLFERSAKSLRLTAAGRTFLSEAEAVLTRADDAIKAARAVAQAEHEELHIGYAPMPTVSFLPQALRAFRKKLPGLRVRLHDLVPEEMLVRLHAGTLDLAFATRPTKAMLRDCHFEELTRDKMRLAVAPGHPLSTRRSVELKEVLQEALAVYTRKEFPEYHAYLDTVFAKVGKWPRSVEEHEDGTSVITAVELGSHVAILPQSLTLTTGTRLRLIPLTPAPPPLIIGALWGNRRLKPSAEQLLRALRLQTKTA